MKKLFYISLLIGCLNAQEAVEPKVTPLEMFLFKIGFTSLVEDVHTQKIATKDNTEDVKKLKSDVKYILQTMNNNKLVESDSMVVENKDNRFIDIQSLKSEVLKLKKEIIELKLKKTQNNIEMVKSKSLIISPKKDIKFKAQVKIQNAQVVDTPNENSVVIRTLNINDIIYVDFCNRNGWCKVEKKWDYVSKSSLEFFTISDNIRNSNFKAKVIVENALIFSSNKENRHSVKEVSKNEILDVKHCDKYGWCKLVDGNYIEKWKLSILK